MVENGCCGTGQKVILLAKMFPGVDLDGLFLGEGRTDGVGSLNGFVPVPPGTQLNPLGLPDNEGISEDFEKITLFVGENDLESGTLHKFEDTLHVGNRHIDQGSLAGNPVPELFSLYFRLMPTTRIQLVFPASLPGTRYFRPNSLKIDGFFFNILFPRVLHHRDLLFKHKKSPFVTNNLSLWWNRRIFGWFSGRVWL